MFINKMPTTEVRDLPGEVDRTLLLFMDGENNLTGDPDTIDRMMERKQPTEVRIVRLFASNADSDQDRSGDEEGLPKVTLTVEEILPENPDDDTKTGYSVPPPDFVDPLSQLDTEAMQSLKNALASEQAKQILGENVTAILDVLSLDDNPATFLQNSIRRDHCYTPLSPSCDPKGASFVNHQHRDVPRFSAESTTAKRGRGRPAKSDVPRTSGTSGLGTSSAKATGSQAEKPSSEGDGESAGDDVAYDSSGDSDASEDRSSDSDYKDPNSSFGRRRGGRKIRGGSRNKVPSGRQRGRPRKEVPVQEHSEEVDVGDVHDISPEKPKVSSGSGKRGRPRKSDVSSNVAVGSSSVHTKSEIPSSTTVEPTPPTPVDHAAAKALSADAIRLGRPVGKSDEERRRDMARILSSLDPIGKSRKIISEKMQAHSNADSVQTKKIATPVTSESVIKEAPPSQVVLPVPDSAEKKTMGGKYPRRENRKLPSHLADTFIPDLFTNPPKKTTTAIPAEETSKYVGKVYQRSLLKYIKKDDPENSPNVSEVQAMPVSSHERFEDAALETVCIFDPIESSLAVDGETLIKSGEGTFEETVVLSTDDVAQEVQLPPPVSHPINVKSVASKKDGGKEERGKKEGRRSSNEGKKHSGEEKATAKHSKVEVKAATTVSESPTSNSDAAANPGPGDDKRRQASKRRRSDEVSDLELDSDIDDTLSEASWNSEDDPERLWCICRKPHNNRFMICCDVCEEWFHGKCVGISKQIGKQMEQDGLEWSCPTCTKKKQQEEREKAKPKGSVQTKMTSFASDSPSTTTTRKCIMCKSPVRENSIYCSDDCIRKHSQRALSQLNAGTKPEPLPAKNPSPEKREERHLIVMDPTSKKVLTGPSAPTASNLATWLQKNPSFHVLFQKKSNKADGTLVKGEDGVRRIVKLQSVDAKPTQMKLAVSPNTKQIKIISHPVKLIQKTVIQSPARKTQLISTPKPGEPKKAIEVPARVFEKKVVDVKAPRQRKEKHQVLQDVSKPAAAVATSSSKKLEEPKEKAAGVSPNIEKAVRESVRRALGEALKSRLTDAADLAVVDSDVDELALKIEERLYKHFDSKTDTKYKSKYRSLVFNIKDPKNETLYRKILDKSISPRELVKLSKDELASQELAQWREKENLHQLEMIKKTELELMTIGQTFILKSHKGEEVIEKDQSVAAVAAEIDPNTSAKELVSALNSVTSTTAEGPDERDKPEKKKKDRDRKRDRDRRHKRDRSRDRGRSKHSKSRRRSRSRSRSRHQRSKSSKSRSSRHSRDSRDKDRDREKSRKEEKTVEPPPVEEISTSQDAEPMAEIPTPDEDFEPTSTVTIKTPDRYPEEPEEVGIGVESPIASEFVWSGQVAMADVAKFNGRAIAVSGDCESVHDDVVDKIHVVGRIPYDTVWDYIARMKKVTTKEILVLQIVPTDDEEDQASFKTLFSYLSKRSRIGVIGRISDHIKDFYLYPHKQELNVPLVLEPLTIPASCENGNTLLGIIVRTKRNSRPVGTVARPSVSTIVKPTPLHLPPKSPSLSSTSSSVSTTTSVKAKLPLPEVQSSSPAESSRSYTPPLPDPEAKVDPRKRKIKVQVKVDSKPKPVEEDDSPYSPASSEEDLPPLSKIPKISTKQSSVEDDAAAMMQKKLDEYNRAIEEETQQLQSLASSVLPAITTSIVAAALPLLQKDERPAASLAPTLPLVREVPLPKPVINQVPKIDEPMELDIPLPPSNPLPAPTNATDLKVKASEAPPAQAITEPAPLLLPGVSQISIPSNLQEILASINKPRPTSEPSKEEVITVADSKSDDDDEVEVIPPPPPIISKSRPDITEVFEKIPERSKSKSIKFDVKLKTIDIPETDPTSLDVDDRVGFMNASEDKDERSILMGLSDRDDRVLESGSFERSCGKDQDERAHKRPSSNRPLTEEEKLEEEWGGSIRRFEAEMRRKNEEIRRKEIDRLRRRDESDSD